MSDIAVLVDKAFDYRGDVTLELKDGRQIVGYLCNRVPKRKQPDAEPFVELMVPGETEKKVIKYTEIRDIRLTGEDTAAGKSWEEWMARQSAKKQTGTNPGNR
jgi:hypothetical protein